MSQMMPFLMLATAQAGESSKHVQRHLRAAFADLGVPKEIKTDNGPGYIAQATSQFLSL